jgi:hypothetical protein
MNNVTSKTFKKYASRTKKFKNKQKLKLIWTYESTQETIMGFSTTQIHYVFSELGQSSLICNLHGFGKKRTS